MTPFKTVSEKLSAWRRYREVARELAQLSDYELHDIGVSSGPTSSLSRAARPPIKRRGDLQTADRIEPSATWAGSVRDRDDDIIPAHSGR